MNETPIGIVTIEYDEDGKVIEAFFKPTEQKGFDLSVINDKLKTVPTSNSTQKVKAGAANVLAQWLDNLNSLELADHFEYGWVGDVKECIKYAGGKIKKCSIEYTFKKLGNKQTF
jgi:hypothetical protein